METFVFVLTNNEGINLDNTIERLSRHNKHIDSNIMQFCEDGFDETNFIFIDSKDKWNKEDYYKNGKCVFYTYPISAKQNKTTKKNMIIINNKAETSQIRVDEMLEIV